MADTGNRHCAGTRQVVLPPLPFHTLHRTRRPSPYTLGHHYYSPAVWPSGQPHACLASLGLIPTLFLPSRASGSKVTLVSNKA